MNESTIALRKSTESDRMGLPCLPCGAWIAEGPDVLVIVDDFKVTAIKTPMDPEATYTHVHATRQHARRVARTLANDPEMIPVLVAMGV